jgi:hypothetical protein
MCPQLKPKSLCGRPPTDEQIQPSAGSKLCDLRYNRLYMWKTHFAELLAEGKSGGQMLADAHRLKRSNLPASLYKYRSFSQQSLDILRTGQVWLASPASFNDPLDSAVTFDIQRVIDDIKTERRTPSPKGSSMLFRMMQGDNCGFPPAAREALLAQTTELYRKVSRQLAEHATRELRSALRICCFSETPTSVPMWAHYTCNHSGFCIQWDLSTWTPERIENLFPVIYDQRPFQKPALALNPPYPEAAILLALRKALDWSYEMEWRYVVQETREGQGCLHELPSPRAVHLGFLMPQEHKDAVSQLCLEREIEVYQVECDLERASLASRKRT